MSPLPVAHSFGVWLPPTMIWAYNQIRYLPDAAPIVLAVELRDDDGQFPWEPLYTVGRAERRLIAAARRRGLPLYPRSYREAFRRHRPRVLHSHFGYQGWYDLALAARHHPAHVVTFYGHDVTMFPKTWPVWRERYRRLFAAADLVLCEGPFMRRSIVALGCPEAKVRVQPLGVETELIEFVARRPRPDGLARILIAGAFREKKGMPLALEAVARVRERHPRVQVTVIGESNGSAAEDAEKRRIAAVVADRGLSDIVTLRGFVPYEDFVAEVREHDIFLSPSITARDGDTEGGAPVSIIETAAAGMPVVASDHCDIPQVVDDGRSGLLAPEGDLGGLVERLAEIVEHPERWEAMGRAGRKLVVERFDVRVCAARLRALYDELLTGPPVPSRDAGSAPAAAAPSTRRGPSEP